MSLKTSKTVPNEVIIGEDRENTHHSSLIMVKNATILDLSAVPVLMIYDSPLLSSSQPSKFVKKVLQMNWL